MTAEELLRHSHEPYRQELIDGRLHEMEPAGAEHGVVEGRIHALLARHVDAASLGTTSTRQASAPRSSVMSASRSRRTRHGPRAGRRVSDAGACGRNRHPRGFWPGPPDLAVEVVSPGDTHSEVQGKALQWLGAGARAVVAVDPLRRTATVYRARDDIRVLAAHESLDLDDVVPGWSPRVGALFA